MPKSPNGQGKTAAIYVRVSSERQGDPEANSVPQQLKQCRDLARRLGLRVHAEYIDSEKYRVGSRMVEPGGGRVDRPALLRLLADGRAGKFTVVVAWKQDRLVRGLKASVTLLEWLDETGMEIALVKETFDRKYFQLLAAVSGMELENIRERMSMGKRGRASRGLWHGGGYLPRGYVHAEHGGVVLDPAWPVWLNTLIKRFLAGEAYAYLARTLEPPPGSTRRLTMSALVRLIRNPWYAGYVAHKGELHPGQHEPVFSADTWAAIQKEVARRQTAPTRRSPSPFTGILRCGYCGAGMTVSAGRYYKGSPRRFYGCWKYTDAQRHGEPLPHAPNYIVENKVWGYLESMLGGLTEANARAFVERLPAIADPGYAARLEADHERVSAEFQDVATALEAVSSARAREVLRAEADSLAAALARLESELGTARAGAVDRAALLAAFMAVLPGTGLRDQPPEEVNVRLRRMFPAGLFAAGGAVSFLPEKVRPSGNE